MPFDNHIMIGTRVMDASANVGTVRWFGKLPGRGPYGQKGHHAGVEFDEGHNGPYRLDGSFGGEQLFECKPGHGELVKPHFLESADLIPLGIVALREHFGRNVESLTDVILIKFLIARKFDHKKTIEMLANHLVWQASFKPCRNEYFPPEIAEMYPVGFPSHSYDKEGNILQFERPANGGKIPAAKFVDYLTLSGTMRWHAAAMETGRWHLATRNAKRITLIVDLKNLHGGGRKIMNFGKGVAKVDQDNYPEQLAHLFIINASSFFLLAWKVIRAFIDPRTKEKIQILGADYYQTLLKYIDEEHIPDFAGGPNRSWMEERGGIVGALKKEEAEAIENVEGAEEYLALDEDLPEIEDDDEGNVQGTTAEAARKDLEEELPEE